MRHPVDLALSDHAYFHRTEPIGEYLFNNSELMLFGHRRSWPRHSFWGFRRPRQHAGVTTLPHLECSRYETAVLSILTSFDHIAFMDEPASFQPIRLTAGLPITPRLPPPVRWLNLGKSVNGSLAGERSHRSEALKSNLCSVQVYNAVRLRWQRLVAPTGLVSDDTFAMYGT